MAEEEWGNSRTLVIRDFTCSGILYMVIMGVDYGMRHYPCTMETMSSMSVKSIWRLMGHVVVGIKVSED